MQQIPLFDASPRWTVTDLTRYLRQLLESDGQLQGIWVQGEISNFSRPASGHLYFTLKDAGAQLRCVMWKGEAARLRVSLQDGLAVEAHGSLGVYETGGQYQLYADTLRPLGEGALYQEFLRLKALLEAEGLFDVERKRPIPDLPRRIGIVTSPTGAALRDMLNTLRRRLPLAEVILAASPVQGEQAPGALVAALEGLNRVAQPDVILLARGGGSIEDLWAFNDPRLVRAVVASQAPVISGVGHETDFTLVDFAADLRAPTPTAAAELATPVTLADLRSGLAERHAALGASLQSMLERRGVRLAELAQRMRFSSPQRRLQTERQRLDDWARRSTAAPVHRLELAKVGLHGLDSRLQALSPLAVLERGYAVVTKEARVVLHRSQVQEGDGLQVRVSDGQFDAQVVKDG
jgi:exodeoxyribonuclease VII large subunit